MNSKPAITITALDAERLEILLDSLPSNMSKEKKALEDELERAVIVAPQSVPAEVVTMNSTVRFRLLPSGDGHCLKLVYPAAAGSGDGAVSILAPVGMALLGLREGDEMSWPRPGGGTLRLVVDEVAHQPERSGDYEA
jgi:regulator of nucleoside diphosphate kinase